MDGVVDMARERDGKEREATAEQTATDLAVRQRERMQRGQQQHYTGWQKQTTAKGEAEREEGYWSGEEEEAAENQQVSVGGAEVIATAMRVGQTAWVAALTRREGSRYEEGSARAGKGGGSAEGLGCSSSSNNNNNRPSSSRVTAAITN